MYLLSMGLIRYIIWTTSLEDTDSIMNILQSHSTTIVSISDRILCVEAELTTAKIRGFVGDEMEMACLEMDEKFVNRLLNKKFLSDERRNFERFLSLTKTPTTIDEALDLINKRGGIEFLSEREVQALDRLTNK